MIHWEKSLASSKFKSISTLLFTIQPKPNESHLIEQSIHIQIDWKLCRECNNLINLNLFFFNIQQFKSLIQGDFFNWSPLFGAKMMKSQRINRSIWSIHQFIWNFAESETIRSISAFLLFCVHLRLTKLISVTASLYSAIEDSENGWYECSNIRIFANAHPGTVLCEAYLQISNWKSQVKP